MIEFDGHGFLFTLNGILQVGILSIVLNHAVVVVREVVVSLYLFIYLIMCFGVQLVICILLIYEMILFIFIVSMPDFVVHLWCTTFGKSDFEGKGIFWIPHFPPSQSEKMEGSSFKIGISTLLTFNDVLQIAEFANLCVIISN